MKKKIKELTVGQFTTITLVVKGATARETRAKKPYLNLELYDGTDTIYGNYWDWAGKNIPDKNAILDVDCQVTEYQGNKQLNIHGLSTNTERHLSEFMPDSGVDLAKTYKDAYALASEIKDDFLRDVTLASLDILSQMWLSIPGAKSVHHAYVGGTLIHSLSVAKIAKAIGDCIPEANSELCFVGGLLHDIGKLYTYKIDGVTVDMTDEGMLFDHTYMGARFINNFAEPFIKKEEDQFKLYLLEHIILSHHGELAYGAAVPPACIEAHIVHRADGADAAIAQIIEASRKAGNAMWTERLYNLNNRPALTTRLVGEVFSGEKE